MASGTNDSRETADSVYGLLDVLVAPLRAYAVYGAVQLGLPDLLRDGVGFPGDLARVAGADPDAVRRLLRMLSSLGVVAGDDTDGYRLAAHGELLCRDHPNSVHDLVLLYCEQAYPAYAKFMHTMRTGEQAFPLAFGTTWLGYFNDHPEIGQRFDRAMNAGNVFFDTLASVLDLSSADSLVDIGGGNGALLRAILEANPGITGVVADLPRATVSAREYFKGLPVADRCEIIPTDFFVSVPEGYDAYLLSRILHDWDDEKCGRILGNCRSAMAEGAMLLVVERVVPGDRKPSLAFDYDLHMLVSTGGRERTLAEYETLFSQAGFAYSHSVDLPLDFSLVVAIAK